MADHERITSVPYPSRYGINDADGKTQTGVMAYYDGGTTIDYVKTNFTGTTKDVFHFQYHPQVDPSTRPLIIDLGDYENGTSLIVEYFTSDSVSGGYGNVYATFKWVDTRTREPLTNYYYEDGDTSRGFYNSYGTNMAIPLGTGSMDQLEYVPIMYVPSKTNYFGSADTHVGDPATYIEPFGGLYIAPTPGLYPITDLSGTVDNSTLQHYIYYGITNGAFNYENGKENFEEGYANAGDGTNPFNTNIPSDKPFENDHSGTGGGYGGYSDKGDETGKPGLPSSGVLSSGFIAMYNPSLANLQALGAKLWSNDFVESILKLWNDPMEAIITLGLIPFTPTSSGSTNCQIGNYDAEISIPRVTSQYETKSCGSVAIQEYWGNALDYAPYTEAEMFLPFVGMKKIDIDDIMNKTVSVDYNIDLLGGESICYVTVDNRVLYDFRCNLMSSVPISSSSYASLYSGILRAASSLAVGAAAGGVGAAAGGLTSAVNVMTSKHGSIERGSDLTPNAGVLGLLTPYIILHRPIQSLPSNFGHFKGYPSNITRTLGSVSGYTEVSYIHLDGISATDAEKEEIYSLLKAGVIL